MTDVPFERYRSALLLVARAMLARQQYHEQSASDLVQQTMLEAHKARDRAEGIPEDELFAWLRKILQNNFLDECRKMRRAKRDVSQKLLEADITQSFVGLDQMLLGSQTSPSEAAIRSEQLTQLAEALEQLPEEQREAVFLKHIVGKTLREITEHLNCTEAATAGYLARGRKRLREVLEGS